LSSFGGGGITVEQLPAPIHAVVNVQYVNGVSGTSDGFELSPDWQPREWWQLRGSYSYVRFDLATAPSSIDVNAVARYTGSSPHHQARLQSQVNLPRGGEVDMAYRYVSALPAQKVPGYHTADLRVGWAASPALELSMAGQNLFTPYHIEFGHSVAPAVGIARSVYVALTWRRARP
jgi:outer membrane receptor protein involved in Fe transport